MMTEQEALALGQRIAADLPLATEVSVVLDQWTGNYAVYVRVHTHEVVIATPKVWPAQVFTTWLEQR